MNSEMNKGETIPTLEQMVEGIVMPQQVADEVECAEELGLEFGKNKRIEALQSALDLIEQKMRVLSSGPMPPFRFVLHAWNHVEEELRTLYGEKLGIE